MSLTDAQKQLIAEKRRQALLKQQNSKTAQSVTPQTSSFSSSKPVFNSSSVPLNSIDFSRPRVALVYNKRPLIQSDQLNAAAVVLSDNQQPQPKKSNFYNFTSFRKTNSTTSSYGKSLTFSSSKESSKFSKAASSKQNSNSAFNGVDAKKLEINCVMISESQFEIRSKYDPDLVNIFKSLSRKEYDTSTRQWRFPVEDFSLVASKIQNCSSSSRYILKPLPSFLLKLVEQNRSFEKIREQKTVDWSLLPNSEELMEFQREGVNWVIGRNGRALIGDEMGLGKTVQALMVAYYYKYEWPLLIVCPSSLRNTWADAISRWLPTVDIDKVCVVNTNKDLYNHERPSVVILSYSLVPKLKEELIRRKFKVAILDESHFVKTGKAMRTKAVQEVVKFSQRLMLLSGTPMMSKPIEMFTQLQLLDKSLFSSQTVFGARYCDVKQRPWGLDYSGSSNLDEFKVLLSLTGLLRRMKKDVLSQLPPKTRKIVKLDRSLTKSKEKSFSALSKQLSVVDVSKLLAGSNKQLLFDFFTQSALVKLPAVINYVDELFESGVEKMLIFGHHVEMLDGLSDHLSNKNLDFIRIDGRTLSSDRQPLVDKFQTDVGCKVALLSILAANTGLTLTAAAVVIFAELYWNPGDLVQAEDRAYRIGQQCNLVVHYLIADKTADDQIWPMIKNKLKIMNHAGLSKDDEDFNKAETTRQVVAPKDQSKLKFHSKGASTKITDFLEQQHPKCSVNGEGKWEWDSNVEIDSNTQFNVFEEESSNTLSSNQIEDDDCWGNDDDFALVSEEVFQTQYSRKDSTIKNNNFAETKQSEDECEVGDSIAEELKFSTSNRSFEVDDDFESSPIIGRRSNDS